MSMRSAAARIAYGSGLAFAAAMTAVLIVVMVIPYAISQAWRWVKLHAVHGGDVDARDDAEDKANWRGR